MNDLAPGTIYRHYKQRLYRVITVALMDGTREPLVVYECLYPNEVGQVWARTETDFFARVQSPEYTGPRFTIEPVT